MIRDTVRVWLKHGERSCGDCRVSKQNFQAFEKLTHQPLEHDKAHGPREASVGGPVTIGSRGVTFSLI